MLFFFLSSASGFSILEMRLQEARFHAPKYNFVPSQSLFLKEPAGFASRGWVAPGEYPQEDGSSYWINDKSHGNYTVEKQKRFCVSHTDGTDFIQTCYTHIMSTFWWGESIRLSDMYLCVGDVCYFSLISKPITIEKKGTTLKHLVKGSCPPKPWMMYSQLTSPIKLEGQVREGMYGFFWYKPIYWATSYHVHRTVISALNTTSSGNIQAVMYPMSKADNLEGLCGFHTGPLGPDLEFQQPDFFEFYPKVDEILE
ncbi:hypothetical protein DSO57_1021578 [Entomophthora muscae]|uniref:Uncharacterized protein n=1 Tax=Entomophthora muscae TaxID=34485 RepID=A0ACC2SS82_9FUNG|nr:hypothetical protein DSO57_1021578 [Entomophthora muscae]